MFLTQKSLDFRILNTQNTFRKLKKHVFRVFFNENTLKIKKFFYFIYINNNNIYNFLTNTFIQMKFFLYFMRWQLSTLVLALPMYYFETLGIGAVLNLVICQCIGAVIFYKIDQLIFKKG